MLWITSTFYVVSTLASIAYSWHVVSSSFADYLRCRVKNRCPHVKFV